MIKKLIVVSSALFLFFDFVALAESSKQNIKPKAVKTLAPQQPKDETQPPPVITPTTTKNNSGGTRRGARNPQ